MIRIHQRTIRTIPIGLTIAGVIHLWITPYHFDHAPAHGIFFAVAGLVQLGLAGLWWRWGWLAVRTTEPPNRYPISPNLLWSSAAFTGGLIVLWVLTQALTTPFAESPEALDFATIVSKLAEIIALTGVITRLERSRASLPYPLARLSAHSSRWFASFVGIWSVSLLVGVVYWGGGMLATPIFPSLGHRHNALNGLSTTAYLTLVNTTSTDDTLVSVSVDSKIAERVTLHTTVITDNIARMRSQDTLSLPAQTRVEFRPGGHHLMLERLSGDLYAGEVVTLRLHFASGRVVLVDFEVLETAPGASSLPQASIDGIEITGAWIRATANTSV